VIDASAPIANYLNDPGFEAHLAEALVARPDSDPTVRAHLVGPDRLGSLLRRGIVRYLLVTVQHVPHLHQNRRHSTNTAHLDAPAPYGDTANVPQLAAGMQRRAELLALTSVDRPGWLLDWLINRIADARGVAAHDIDPFLALSELGVDSLMSLELRHRIAKEFAVALTAVDMLGAPDLRALASVIATALAADSPAPEWEEAEL